MMDRFFDEASQSALPADFYPVGWMTNHMNWMVGPTFFGFTFFGWLTIVLVDVVLVLLALRIWQQVTRRK